MHITFVYGGFENIGIEMLSAFVKDAGHTTSLIFDPILFDDGYMVSERLKKYFDAKDRLVEEIRCHDPDLVAFSTVTHNYLWACTFAEMIKKRLDVPIVFGGIHVTSVPENAIKKEYVDFVIVGEAEDSFLDLVNALEKGESVYDIPNLWCRKDGEVISNPVRPLRSNLDELPYPDKELFFDVSPVLADEYRIVTLRNYCPYHCSFCSSNIVKRLYKNKGFFKRRRSVDNTIGELKLMKERYNYKSVTIFDEVFFIRREWVAEFCEKYKKEIGVPFKSVTHPKVIDAESLKMVKDAGCNVIQMGIQSICDNTRKNVIFRPETNDDIREASKLMKEARIPFEMDHIMGFPYETKEDQIEAARFYNEIRPDSLNFYWLRYFPRTDIIPIAKEAGLIDDDYIKDIEEGRIDSFFRGRDTKNRKIFEEFNTLFILIPILPRGVIEVLIKTGIYKYLRYGTTLFIFTRVIKALFWHDGRLRLFRKHYQRFLFRELLSKLGLKGPLNAERKD